MDLDSVLKQMRTEYTPNDDDRRRVETALTATLVAAGTATGAAHLAGSVGVKSALAKGSLKLLPVWFKSTLGVSATVAAIGGGVYGVSEYRSHQTTAHATPAQSIAGPSIAGPSIAGSSIAGSSIAGRSAPSTQREHEAKHAVASAVETRAALPQALDAMAVPAVTQVPPVRNVAVTTPERPTRVAIKHTPVSIGHGQLTSLSELQLLSEASRALQEGRAEDAQRVLREHERRYTQTALEQERTGLTLLARCTNGDASAHADATRFLLKVPNSPLGARIKRECLK